jgi:hypothetical protein
VLPDCEEAPPIVFDWEPLPIDTPQDPFARGFVPKWSVPILFPATVLLLVPESSITTPE